MRLSLKARQVAGVTSIVGLAVGAFSVMHLASLATVRLEESLSRALMLANALFQRAHQVVGGPGDPYTAIRDDPGIRVILESSIGYSPNVTYAAILDSQGIAIAHSFPTLQGQRLQTQGDLAALLEQGPIARLQAIYSDRSYEVRQKLLLGTEEFGSIRIGVSPVLIRADLAKALEPAAVTASIALLVALGVSMALAQWLLRPIHVIRSGLTRLGRGERGVRLDLPSDDEFGEIGRSFESLSARLATTEGDDPGTSARLQSAVELLEDAVGIFAPDGRVLFANAAMRHLVSAGEGGDYSLPADHPWRTLVARTVADGEGGPVSNTDPSETAGAADRLVSCHPIRSPAGVVAAVILSRNLEYLSKVESTLEYSRKLAALGRLTAGVAHEVKNPLNAMAIHLELLKRKLVRPVADRDAGVTPGTTSAPEELQAAASGVAGAAVANAGRAESQADVAGALGHAGVIEGEIHRLDGVVQGFLKFIRPAELTLQPTDLGALIDDVVRVVQPQADSRLITVRAEHAPGLPFIDADAGMLRQALLNLALNACEAMPGGGTLGIATRQAGQRTVLIEVADTGVGIDPGHLGRIFDLYFTTKPEGSGIGLSLVYRIVQLHDGDIEVESTPGRGTTFRITLPVGNTKAPSRHVNS